MTLENSILEFIKDNNDKQKNVDSIDIVVKFRERVDHSVILKTIAKLQEAGKIQRKKWLGFKYGYIVIEKVGVLR